MWRRSRRPLFPAAKVLRWRYDIYENEQIVRAFRADDLTSDIPVFVVCDEHEFDPLFDQRHRSRQLRNYPVPLTRQSRQQ